MAVMSNVMSCFAVAAMLVTVATATSYTVGDSSGWSSGVDYTAWVSGKTFKVGDELDFTYLPNHDVLEVTKANYDSCTATNPISSYSGGSTTITLTKVGKRYFICGTIGHCEQGMLLEVDITAFSSSPPTPPSPATPPPSSPKTPPPAGSPPPPSSSPKTPSPAATAPTSDSTPKAPPKAPNTPKAMAPSPNVSKVSPPPPSPSSAYKISHGAFFAFALLILAAI